MDQNIKKKEKKSKIKNSKNYCYIGKIKIFWKKKMKLIYKEKEIKIKNVNYN